MACRYFSRIKQETSDTFTQGSVTQCSRNGKAVEDATMANAHGHSIFNRVAN
uniref:Uncharacterized protein n=1 Tax=Anguilla anguilla TaxID=7936 RepID=A0A0E9X5D1_ANGAN